MSSISTSSIAIRKLPVGIQNFEDLRTNDYLYVDKTAYVYSLATMGKPHFLGRPRRFINNLPPVFMPEKDEINKVVRKTLAKRKIKYVENRRKLGKAIRKSDL